MPETKWSDDIKANLLQQSKGIEMITLFHHDYQAQWKTEQLQMIKLFAEELNCKDPFHIPGQDWGVTNRDSEQNNYLNNFIDTENIDDFEDLQIFENLPGKGASEVQFKKFHEVSV